MLVQATAEQLAQRAASILARAVSRCLTTRRQAVLAVPGGRSVAAVFAHLRRQDVPWDRVHIFLLDERLVPADHEDSNTRLVKEHLASVSPAEMFHGFPFHPDNPERGVSEYSQELERCGGRFDIVLASSGEDGHIASLFPRHRSLADPGAGFILVKDAPKPPSARMSASRALIGRADTGVVLFLGSAKAGALHKALDACVPVDECPAKLIMELPHSTVLTDQEAVRP